MAALLRDYPAANFFVAAVLELLVEIETGKPNWISDAVPARGRRKTRLYRKGDAVLGYRVEGKPHDERLEEVRQDSGWKCPQNVYRAVARAVAAAPQSGLRWHDISQDVTMQLQYKPSVSQTRIPVRFWLSLEPPLISRYATRIRPADTATFVDETERVWRELKKKTAEQDRQRSAEQDKTGA